MKPFLALPAALLLLAASPAHATEPLKDYSFVRGVCHTGWAGDPDTVERELGYAKKLQLNSARIWLNINRYEANPAAYIERLRNYVRTAHKYGLSTMPILFNGNGLNPATLQADFHQRDDAYVKAVVDALKDEPGLFIWDIMNEPTWNDYYNQATPAQLPQREEEINQFVRYNLALVKKLDPKNATTVGHTFAKDLKIGGDLVDVLCFHDYLDTRARIEASYTTAEGYAKEYNKPFINSELGCVGRANPYDLALEVCEEHKAGWYVFELMIKGNWSTIHGLVYPDGTIRDPSIIAAIYGFHRNRDETTRILELPNKENHAAKAFRAIQDALAADAAGSSPKTTDQLLEACEYAANLLEAAQMVPMHDPPTVQILTLRKQKDRKVAAIRTLASNLGELLKKNGGF